MTKKWNRIKILGLACIATLSMGLITGCGNKDTTDNTDTPVTEGTQDPGGSDTTTTAPETPKTEEGTVQPEKSESNNTTPADTSATDEKDALQNDNTNDETAADDADDATLTGEDMAD